MVAEAIFSLLLCVRSTASASMGAMSDAKFPAVDDPESRNHSRELAQVIKSV
jgi:hypothetical protein